MDEIETTQISRSVLAQFVDAEGKTLGSAVALPTDVTPEQLELLLNQLEKTDEPTPYTFKVGDTELQRSIQQDILDDNKVGTEETLKIVYVPQAVFRVRAVTRCSTAMQGHTEPVLAAAYAPNGKHLATGAADRSVRLWDLNTETPKTTLDGHTSHVMCLSWSADAEWLASGDFAGDVILWRSLRNVSNTKKRKQESNNDNGTVVATSKQEEGQNWKLRGHKKTVTGISWEPLHSLSSLDANANQPRFATSSKDCTVKIWDPIKRAAIFTFGSHTDGVMAVKWGGNGLIYTGSRDRSVKVWSADRGILVRSLEGHAHWINSLAVSSDFVLRTGYFDHHGAAATSGLTPQQLHAKAQERYAQFTKGKKERLISGSDDFTMFLWEPETGKKPVARLTGHQQLIPQVAFSPDAQYIASCSFDKSVKIWDGNNGQFLFHLRGHVGAVYQIAWSSDSRMLVSASKDSTIKLWSMRERKMKTELPGHADEVYAVDWSPGGESIASGGKDNLVRIWRR